MAWCCSKVWPSTRRWARRETPAARPAPAGHRRLDREVDADRPDGAVPEPGARPADRGDRRGAGRDGRPRDVGGPAHSPDRLQPQPPRLHHRRGAELPAGAGPRRPRAVQSAAGPPEQPIRDVPDLFRYLRTAGEGGVGQPVHLVGMVAHGDSLAADEFVLLRYSIVHCVADAQPLGLLVQTPDASAGASSATWVEVDGTLASTQHGGAHLVSVIASRVSPTREPPDPYL